MTAPHRHLTLLAALCLTACTSLPTAPEPAEFKLTSDEIRQQSKASRTLGIVELFADEIRSSQNEKGEPFHLASGKVLLVKKSTPPIQAKASEILLNSEHAEVRGLSVVKKGDLLHFGEAEASRIIIDGVQILPKGPHSIKRLSNEPTKSVPAADKEIKPEPVPPAPEIKPEPRPQPKRKTTPPNRKPKPVSKPTPKPSPPKPEAPAVDREKLRQLMREPE
jgi:hypothetical protein